MKRGALHGEPSYNHIKYSVIKKNNTFNHEFLKQSLQL